MKLKNAFKIYTVFCLFLFGMIIVTLLILFYTVFYAPLIPENYISKIKTDGVIEKKYLNMGNFTTKSYSGKKVVGLFEEYLFYYPEELKTSNKTYPVVLYLNGLGVFASKLKNLFKHLASWGFIVLGNYDLRSYTGTSANETLSYLFKLNEDEKSVFYKKIDISNIGITGHSYGGIGVFNAINNNSTNQLYKCAISISPSEEDEIDNYEYNTSETNIPIFLISGTYKDISHEKLQIMYDSMDLSPIKVLARKSNMKQSQMIYSADGYATAWFRYFLMNDNEAGQFFLGDHPEILNNTLYQDQLIRKKN